MIFGVLPLWKILVEGMSHLHVDAIKHYASISLL